ncbi:MAG: hypothetical protein APR53_04195 [Methanoculleus sp. SDB]|nr:MAG: hypothetical protein APR53_04195 [Methanoculleus sp. SDB]
MRSRQVTFNGRTGIYCTNFPVRVPLIVPSNTDYERVNKIILDILIKNPKILPDVSKTEELKIFNIFKFKPVSEMDVTTFKPRILFSEMESGKITPNINFWISDISEKMRLYQKY